MSKNVVRIVLSAVAVVVLSVILIIGLTGGFEMFKFNFNFNIHSKTFGSYNYPDSELYSRGNAEISADGIEKLNIDWISDSVKVETHSGSMVSISEIESEKLNDDEKLCYLVKDGVLYIKFFSPKDWKGWELKKAKQLTVLLPESMGVLKDCTVNTVSANMSVKDIASDKFKLESTSGDIFLNAKGKSEHINIDTTSGNIEISVAAESVDCESTSGTIRYSGEVQKIDCDSTSGDIQLDASVKKVEMNTTSGKIEFAGKADELYAHTTSGDIAVSARVNKVKCDTNSGLITFGGEVYEIISDSTSGDVNIESGVCPNKIDVETTSGQITLTLPGDKGFTAYYDTLSGDFRCDFSVKISNNKAVYGDGSAQFNLSATSGDITIKSK